MLPVRKITPASAYPQPALSSSVKTTLLIVFAVAIVALFTASKNNVELVDIYFGSKAEFAMLSDLIAVGLGLSDQAADVIKEVKRAHVENMHVKGLTAEGVIEPVTDADQKSNRIFVNGFRNHFPGIRILSEETEPEVNTKVKSSVFADVYPFADSDRMLELKDVVITVDPLDATKEFTEDLLQYVTTMVCIVHNGRPIAGIINEVFSSSPSVVGIVGDMSEMKSGALFGRDNRHEPEGIAVKTVTISRSHTGAGEDVVSKYFPEHHSLQAGGAGYKALLVLDGEANAYVHVTKIKSWDVCAADAVLNAISGGFTDVDGNELKYSVEDPVFTRGIVATRSKSDQDWYLEHLDGNMS